MTERINLLVSSFGDEFMQEGDEVILSVMEHHSNIVPWQLLVFILQKLPLVIHRNDLNGDAFFSSQQLPGNDIAVMLHDGKNQPACIQLRR